MMAMLDQPIPAETDLSIAVNGERLTPDVSGAAFVPAFSALLVADLHFEKGSSYAERGRMLPPYDTRETLLRLTEVIHRRRPETVVALGDSFHDLRADGRMHADDADVLAALVRSVARWVWIEGNHDPAPPPRFGGEIVPETRLGALTLRHEPQPGPQPGEVAGHLHPCARVRGRGRSVRRRCFLSDGTRLILPAFGAYTGGLNCKDDAFAPCFERAPDAWVIGREKVYPVPARRLSRD